MIVKDLKHTLHLILPGLEESLTKLRKIFTNSKKLKLKRKSGGGERERETYTFFFGFGNKYGIS